MNEQALKEQIKAIARRESRTFQDVWKHLLLERLLVRLSRSSYNEYFVFKGGLLLAYYVAIGRETTDVDLLAHRLTSQATVIQQAFASICAIEMGDDMAMHVAGVEELDHAVTPYPGYRVKLDVQLGKMRDRIQVDVGAGDVVTPNWESFELYRYNGQPIFEGAISLQVYPIERLFAEKLETVQSRGGLNSRMKDFHDLLLISRNSHLIDAQKLKHAIASTMQHRGSQGSSSIGLSQSDIRQLNPRWRAHLRGLGSLADSLNLPNELDQLVYELNEWLRLNVIK